LFKGYNSFYSPLHHKQIQEISSPDDGAFKGIDPDLSYPIIFAVDQLIPQTINANQLQNK